MPLNLTKPGEGTVGWAAAVNQNFTEIEDAIGRAYNIIRNGSFERWSNGTSAVAPDHWTRAFGGNGTDGRESTTVKIGTYALRAGKASGLGVNYQLDQDFTGLFPVSGAYLNGRQVTFGCWVRTATASLARIALTDGAVSTYSTYHSGDDTWQFLTVTRTFASSTGIKAQIHLDTTNGGTAYFDGAIVREGASATIFIPNHADTVIEMLKQVRHVNFGNFTTTASSGILGFTPGMMFVTGNRSANQGGGGCFTLGAVYGSAATDSSGQWSIEECGGSLSGTDGGKCLRGGSDGVSSWYVNGSSNFGSSGITISRAAGNGTVYNVRAIVVEA